MRDVGIYIHFLYFRTVLRDPSRRPCLLRHECICDALDVFIIIIGPFILFIFYARYVYVYVDVCTADGSS